MKNIEAVVLHEKLTKGLENCTVGLPVEINAARRKNVRALKPIVEDFVETRNDLIKQYGTEDENGNFSAEVSNKEFVAELNKLAEMENDITLVTFDEALIPSGLTPSEYDILAEMAEEGGKTDGK